MQTAGSGSGLDLGAYSQLEDGELIKRLLGRDTDAWNELIVRYQRLVYAQVVKAVPRKLGRVEPSLIEDIMSEVFLGLLRNDLAALRSFKGDCKFSTWLSVISRRVAWRQVSKLPRERQLPGLSDSAVQVELGITIDVDSLAKLIGVENRLQLAECMGQLKPADRRILEMFYYEQLDYREIGQAMGLSINAVGPKLSRAHARLRRLLGRD